MQHTIKTITAVALLSVPALTQTSLPGGTANGSATRSRTFEQVIAASTTSYQASGELAMSPTRREAISATLLTLTGSALSPGHMGDDGQLFYYDSTDVSAMLHFDTATSTVLFDKGVGQISGMENTPNLPTDTQAPDLARELVELVDFLPAHAEELVVDHVGGMGLGVQAPDGTRQNFDKLVSVRFGRKIGGMKVMGPGSRIVVQLGEDGGLHGVIRRWHEFDALPITAAQKHTPYELNQMVRQQLNDATGQASDVRFESATLVLYDDGQGIMEPAIRFVFQMIIDSEYPDATGQMLPHTMTNPLDFYVPILRQTRASFPFVKDLQAQTQATPTDANEPPPSNGGDDE